MWEWEWERVWGAGQLEWERVWGMGQLEWGQRCSWEVPELDLGSSVQDTAITSAATTMSPAMIQRPARCGLGQFMLGICNLPSQLG